MSGSSDTSNGSVPGKKCRFQPATVIGDLDDLPKDIDRLAQEILSLGLTRLPRHRSLSSGEEGARDHEVMRPRSASRGSLGRDADLPALTALTLPRNASFTAEADLDTYYEGVPMSGFSDSRPLTRRYQIVW